MNRIALVTGGVTGIGAATCLALEAAGYQVVANYFGNDAEAKEIESTSGLPIYAWDVADLDAYAKGVAGITAQHGPIEVLVNNAGITGDAMRSAITRSARPASPLILPTAARWSTRRRWRRTRARARPSSMTGRRKRLRQDGVERIRL